MGLDLDSAAECFFKHWPQLFRFFGEITGSLGRVVVRLQQRRAARTERAIKNNFDRALGEMMIERADRRAFLQKVLRVFARPINAIDQPDLCSAFAVNFFDEINVVLVTAGILNFAPAEADLAIDSGEQHLFAIARRRLRNIFANEFLRGVEQHSGRLAGLFVF